MLEESILSEGKRLCACGCGTVLVKKWGYNARYVSGHNPSGRKFKKGENRGALNPRWKGGRSLTQNGYIMLRGQWNHPRAHKGKILEHIVVFEKYHKCCVLKSGDIHHKNGNRQDNRPENLEGIMKGQHTQNHKTIDMSNRCCNVCNNTETTKHRINGRPKWCFVKTLGWLCHKCYMKYWRSQSAKIPVGSKPSIL